MPRALGSENVYRLYPFRVRRRPPKDLEGDTGCLDEHGQAQRRRHDMQADSEARSERRDDPRSAPTFEPS